MIIIRFTRNHRSDTISARSFKRDTKFLELCQFVSILFLTIANSSERWSRRSIFRSRTRSSAILFLAIPRRSFVSMSIFGSVVSTVTSVSLPSRLSIISVSVSVSSVTIASVVPVMIILVASVFVIIAFIPARMRWISVFSFFIVARFSRVARILAVIAVATSPVIVCWRTSRFVAIPGTTSTFASLCSPVIVSWMRWMTVVVGSPVKSLRSAGVYQTDLNY